MKNFTLLCIALHFATTAFSQNYIPIDTNDTQWNYRKIGGCQEYSYHFKGDTIINSSHYFKLYKIGANYAKNPQPCDYQMVKSTFNSLLMLVRNDTASKKVYMRKPNGQNDKLLFDFDLKIGDTVENIAVKLNGRFIVHTTSTDLIAGKNRNIYIMSGDSIYNNTDTLRLIEGIGFLNGDFESTDDIVYSYVLKCYKEGANTFPKNQNCSLITKIKRYTKESEGLVLAPNPTKGHIELSTKANLKKIIVYNLQGQKLQEINPQKRSWELPKKSGIYLIRLQDENGNYYTKKIIKS